MPHSGLFFDNQTKGSWVYDGTNFYTTESPQSITAKRQFTKGKHLAGIMMYSLEADDLASILLNAATGFIS
jgi:GH18 family chitinase